MSDSTVHGGATILGKIYADQLIFDGGRFSAFTFTYAGKDLFRSAYHAYTGLPVGKYSDFDPKLLGKTLELGLPKKKKKRWQIFAKKVKALKSAGVTIANDRNVSFDIDTFPGLQDLLGTPEKGLSFQFEAVWAYCPRCGESQFESRLEGKRIPGVGAVFSATYVAEELGGHKIDDILGRIVDCTCDVKRAIDTFDKASETAAENIAVMVCSGNNKQKELVVELEDELSRITTKLKRATTTAKRRYLRLKRAANSSKECLLEAENRTRNCEERAETANNILEKLRVKKAILNDHWTKATNLTPSELTENIDKVKKLSKCISDATDGLSRLFADARGAKYFTALAMARFYRREWLNADSSEEHPPKVAESLIDKLQENSPQCYVRATFEGNGSHILDWRLSAGSLFVFDDPEFTYIADYGKEEWSDFRYDNEDIEGPIFVRISSLGVNSEVFEEAIQRSKDSPILIVKVRTLRKMGVEISQYSYEKAIEDITKALDTGLENLKKDTAYVADTGDKQLALMLAASKKLIIRFDLEGVLELSGLRKLDIVEQDDPGRDPDKEDARYFRQYRSDCIQFISSKTMKKCGDGEDNDDIKMHAMNATIKIQSRVGQRGVDQAVKNIVSRGF